MTHRHTVAAFALAALTLGCDNAKREKARADSIIADSLVKVVRDRAAADSAHRADTIAAIAAKAQAPPMKAKSTGSMKQGAELGRDSVRTGVKIMSMPTVADTAKRRPPR